MKYLIIGNSVSAVAAIEGIRSQDKKGEITVISNEPYYNYSRPLISYFLGEKILLKDMSFRSKDFYEKNKIKLILNVNADRVDAKKKYVVLSDKRKLNFDKLLIASGGVPIISEIKNSDPDSVFTFTNLNDAVKMKKYIKTKKVKKAAVLGGGLIGLKVTEALIELGVKVTIIELADRILAASFDKKASNIIQKALEKIGCGLITNNTVSEIIKDKSGNIKKLVLKNKKTLDTDLLITAIGVNPNKKLAEEAALKTDKGILVDVYMRTNVKDIYAAGDCASARDLLLSVNRPIAIWPAAARQGKVAGYNMAGGRKKYAGSFAMNSVELCGIPTISVGETNPAGKGYEVLEEKDDKKSLYKKLVLKDNKIVGVILVGDIDRGGIYTGLIKEAVDLSSCFSAEGGSASGGKGCLLKEDFGLISLPKEYRKHLVAGEAAII